MLETTVWDAPLQGEGSQDRGTRLPCVPCCMLLLPPPEHCCSGVGVVAAAAAEEDSSKESVGRAGEAGVGGDCKAGGLGELELALGGQVCDTEGPGGGTEPR